MCLAKDISEGPLPRHALRRIEQLRRTVGDTLLKLTGGEGAGPRPAEGGLELPRT